MDICRVQTFAYSNSRAPCSCLNKFSWLAIHQNGIPRLQLAHLGWRTSYSFSDKSMCFVKYEPFQKGSKRIFMVNESMQSWYNQYVSGCGILRAYFSKEVERHHMPHCWCVIENAKQPYQQEVQRIPNLAFVRPTWNCCKSALKCSEFCCWPFSR